jgi:hypothetical protein
MRLNNKCAFTFLAVISFAVIFFSSQVTSLHPEISTLISELTQSSNQYVNSCSFRQNSILTNWVNLSARLLIILSFSSLGIPGYYFSTERYIFLYRKKIIIFLSGMLLISLFSVSGVFITSSIGKDVTCHVSTF